MLVWIALLGGDASLCNGGGALACLKRGVGEGG